MRDTLHEPYPNHPDAAARGPAPAAAQAVHELPEDERFCVRGQEFRLDLLEAIYAFRDLATALPEGATTRDYLAKVIAWVREHAGVELTWGEADWLNDRLDLLYAVAKKKRADAIASALTSRSSTE